MAFIEDPPPPKVPNEMWLKVLTVGATIPNALFNQPV